MPASDDSSDAHYYTERMRCEEADPWDKIRAELRRRDIDPERTIMGASVPEDTGMECLLLLPDRAIVEFEVRWLGGSTEIVGWEVLGGDRQFS